MSFGANIGAFAKEGKNLAKSALDNLTLEPVVIFYTISYGLNEVIRPNLLLIKACRQKLNYTEDICNNLPEEGYEVFQDEVQKVVSDYEALLSLCAFFPRIFYALIAGAWSDRNGRKPILALPLFGQFLMNLTFILNYAFLTEWPFEMLYLEFINELCGTFVVYYLAVYTYMADVTEEATRTTRISFVDGFDYIFTMVGTFISGYIFEAFGFIPVYSASAASALTACFYVIFVLKEAIKRGEDMENIDSIAKEVNDYGSTDNKRSMAQSGSTCSKFPNPKDVIAGFLTIFKKREKLKRPMILMLVFNFACYIFTYNGTEGSHRYLYVRKKYGWDTKDFTNYLSFVRVFYMIALWIILPLASKVIRLHDATVAIVVCATGAFGQALPALLNPGWVFYLGAIFSSLSPAATITARSMSSRCVAHEEIGRLFAVISLMSAVSSSLITSAYQKIYSATKDEFPGTFLLVNAGFFLITVPINAFLRKKLD